MATKAFKTQSDSSESSLITPEPEMIPLFSEPVVTGWFYR
jgi:hypothetical protein